jgi:hypothetical protein
LDLRGRKWWEDGEDCIMRSFITCTRHQIFIRVIRSRRTRWVEHVARLGEIRNPYNIFIGKPERKRAHSENLGIDGRISE